MFQRSTVKETLPKIVHKTLDI